MTYSWIIGLILLLTSSVSMFQEPPLSTRGSFVLDSQGDTLRFIGVNWWGASGSKYWNRKGHKNGTDTHSMPFGLHVQRVEVIAKAIKGFGFNAVRLPFSNQMLHSQVKAHSDWVGPNNELAGLTPIQVLDSVVKALTDQGLMVILNNHTTTTHWCCDYDWNGLWFGKNPFHSQTTEDWINDWVMLAGRYKDNQLVVAADLRNEVRPQRPGKLPFPQNPNWGKGNKKDWRLAAIRAGNAIHKVNPDWLIMVEGINGYTKNLTNLQLPHLKPVPDLPVILEIPNKVVYEIHNYGFSFVEGNFLKRKKMVRYSDVHSKTRVFLFDGNWGFLMDENSEFKAPVILGEFGCGGNTPQDGNPWFRDLTGYIYHRKIGFFWWTLEESLTDQGSYGIMNEKLDRVNVDEDWRWEFLERLFEKSDR